MIVFLKKAAFAVPFGCLTAIATHYVRFGDDHAFGGEGNEALVSATVAGVIGLAFGILLMFLRAGSTTTTGTIARARVNALLPHSAVIFAIAAFTYYGIESLEGNGIELGLPTVVLGLFSVLVGFLLRRLAALLAGFASDLTREWFARLGARNRIVWHLAPAAQPVHVETLRVARRFGRAPPSVRTH
jgi:hypothetical protein